MDVWDYIIIGSGSSGSVVANRLSAPGGGSVLMLEAGNAARDLRFHVPVAGRTLWHHPKATWMFQSEPEPGLDGRRLPIPRGRVLGGSSAINGAVYNRGSPHDYDAWADAGIEGWDFPALLPYFKRLEDHWRGADALHGAGGPVPISPLRKKSRLTPAALEAARQMGFPVTDDFSGSQPEGWGLPDLNVDRRGRRISSATAFLLPAMSRKSLTVKTGAQVLRIIVDKGRATGVEYVQNGQRKTAMADREVIVSGGSIGSPHILQLSGIGPADDLRALGIDPVHDLPGVGRNFWDQAAGFMIVGSKVRDTFEHNLRFDQFLIAMAQWALGMGGPLAGPPTIALANVRTTQGTKSPDMRFMLSATTTDAKVWFPGIRAGNGYKMMGMFTLAHPKSRGSVTLASADPLVKPRVQYNLLTDPEDVAGLRRAYRLMVEYLGQPALRDIVGDSLVPPRPLQSDQEVDAFLRTVAGTTQHPVGSCRMGLDTMAVVDGQCRVHGVEGLRVIDLSVFPGQISGNPHGPAMMLGDRVSDMILGKPPLPSATGI